VGADRQQEIMTMYKQISADETPQVRKQAAIVLNEMIKLIPKVSETELLNIFSRFYKDEQDTVRMQGIDSCVCFAHQLPPAKVTAYLLPYIKKFADDKSWRIRYLVADRIMDLARGPPALLLGVPEGCRVGGANGSCWAPG
jgi:serine/threonine-protein phosphatase 2A regulatory subunit A